MTPEEKESRWKVFLEVTGLTEEALAEYCAERIAHHQSEGMSIVQAMIAATNDAMERWIGKDGCKVRQ